MKLIKFLTQLILIMTFNSQVILAQGNWTYFTKENTPAIPKSIRIFLEDNQNNLWVGTALGLYMFDGNHWKKFTTKDGLLDINITSLIEDSKGTIWIGTAGGVSTFKNGSVKKTEHTFPNGGFPRLYIGCIYEDSHGNIWIGTGKIETETPTRHTTGKLMKYDGDSCVYISRYSDPPLFNWHSISEIMEDKYGKIWVASGWIYVDVQYHHDVFAGHLSRYDNGEWTYYIDKIPYNDKWIIDDIYKDRSGNLWFQARSLHGYGYLIQYDGNVLKFHSEKSGFLSYVSQFYEDSSGRFWFGGPNGLVYWENIEDKDFPQQDSLIKSRNVYVLNNINVNFIKEDSYKNIWIGTRRGLYVYTGTGLKSFTINTGLSGITDNVIKIAEDFEGKMWILTQELKLIGKGEYYLSKINPDNWSAEPIPQDKILKSGKTLEMYEDLKKNVWFFTDNAIMKYFK